MLIFGSLLAAGVTLAGSMSTSASRPGWDTDEGTGQHRRIETPNGPVHVFLPQAYDFTSAGLVFYIHGYFTDVDEAWKQHELASQFASSGRNAMFIVPEAPTGNTQGVKWHTVASLKEAVVRQADIALPAGASVVLLHSGGWRTMQGWLAGGSIDSVVMLDGLYGGQAELSAWLTTPQGSRPGSLVMVGADTSPSIEKFIEAFPDTEVLDEVPPLPRAQKVEPKGRVLFMRSQFGHMEIVTQRSVIPSVLQMTPLNAVNTAS